MQMLEVIELFEAIKLRYDNFSCNKEKRQAWHDDHLKNIPFELAIENLRRHSATEKWPPTIADLSRPLQEADDRFHEFMKAEPTRIFNDLDEARKKAVPPPESVKERMRQIAAGTYRAPIQP